MGILTELAELLSGLGVSVETGVFSGVAPEEYAVITPMTDTFELFAADRPEFETQEARLSLYSKKNYSAQKNSIVLTLLNADFTITGRQYIGHEDDTKYHHYAIDVAKIYPVGV